MEDRDVDFTSLGLSWNGGQRHDDGRHSAADCRRGRALVCSCLLGTEEGAQAQTEARFPQEKALEFGGLADRPRWIPRSMLSDIEIFRAAQVTIQTYGDGAGLHAAQRADALMAEGDMEGRRVWHRIEDAINELTRRSRSTGEPIH